MPSWPPLWLAWLLLLAFVLPFAAATTVAHTLHITFADSLSLLDDAVIFGLIEFYTRARYSFFAFLQHNNEKLWSLCLLAIARHSPHLCQSIIVIFTTLVDAGVRIVDARYSYHRNTTIAQLRQELSEHYPPDFVQTLRDEHDDNGARLEQQIKELKSEVLRSNGELKTSQDAKIALQHKLDTVSNQLELSNEYHNVEAAEDDITDLKAELAEVEEKYQRAQQRISEDQWNYEDRQKLVREYEAKLGEKQQVIDQRDEEIALLKHNPERDFKLIQLDRQSALLIAVKKVIHDLVASNNERGQDGAILFISAMIERGIDLTELEIDPQQLQKYLEWVQNKLQHGSSPLRPTSSIELQGFRGSMSSTHVSGNQVFGPNAPNFDYVSQSVNDAYAPANTDLVVTNNNLSLDPQSTQTFWSPLQSGQMVQFTPQPHVVHFTDTFGVMNQLDSATAQPPAAPFTAGFGLPSASNDYSTSPFASSAGALANGLATLPTEASFSANALEAPSIFAPPPAPHGFNTFSPFSHPDFATSGVNTTSAFNEPTMDNTSDDGLEEAVNETLAGLALDGAADSMSSIPAWSTTNAVMHNVSRAPVSPPKFGQVSALALPYGSNIMSHPMAFANSPTDDETSQFAVPSSQSPFTTTAEAQSVSRAPISPPKFGQVSALALPYGSPTISHPMTFAHSPTDDAISQSVVSLSQTLSAMTAAAQSVSRAPVSPPRFGQVSGLAESFDSAATLLQTESMAGHATGDAQFGVTSITDAAENVSRAPISAPRFGIVTTLAPGYLPTTMSAHTPVGDGRAGVLQLGTSSPTFSTTAQGLSPTSFSQTAVRSDNITAAEPDLSVAVHNLSLGPASVPPLGFSTELTSGSVQTVAPPQLAQTLGQSPRPTSNIGASTSADPTRVRPRKGAAAMAKMIRQTAPGRAIISSFCSAPTNASMSADDDEPPRESTFGKDLGPLFGENGLSYFQYGYFDVFSFTYLTPPPSADPNDPITPPPTFKHLEEMKRPTDPEEIKELKAWRKSHRIYWVNCLREFMRTENMYCKLYGQRALYKRNISAGVVGSTTGLGNRYRSAGTSAKAKGPDFLRSVNVSVRACRTSVRGRGGIGKR